AQGSVPARARLLEPHLERLLSLIHPSLGRSRKELNGTPIPKGRRRLFQNLGRLAPIELIDLRQEHMNTLPSPRPVQQRLVPTLEPAPRVHDQKPPPQRRASSE